MQLSRWNRRRGMSLAEILLAMAILTIFTLAIATVLIRGGDLNRRDGEVFQTTTLCNGLIEQTLYNASTPAGFANLPVDVPYTFIGDRTGSQLQYIYSEHVDDFDTLPDSGVTMKKLTVRIYAQDPAQPATPTPDLSRGRGGQIVKMSVVITRPENQ